MMLLVVNYHYVAAERPSSPRGIFPVSVAELRTQLELLGRTLDFVSRDQLLEAVRDGAALPERSCLVTFDDGLRCQFELALPVLESLGVPGLFLVPGQPLAESRALYVHKVHHLLEQLAPEELLRRFDLETVSEEEAVRHYTYDRPEVARIKYLLNVVTPLTERDALIAETFGSACEDEVAFCEELYLSAEQVATLERQHGAVGAHSYAHEPLARLEPAAIEADLTRNAAVLADTTGRRPEVISYPHGSVSPDVTAAAAKSGFVVGFTMERVFNRSLEQPLELGRVDANDAPGGRRPIGEIAAIASSS